MKTKLFTLFLALIASARFLLASVQIGDLYYNLNAEDMTAEVTYKYYNSSVNYSGITNINIPSSVKYNGTAYKVTSIGSYAFMNCKHFTSVTIPYSVTSIGNYAFSGCSGLTSITIPNSVTNIGESAFYYCTGLISVTIPNNVTSIGGFAFYNCNNLTSVTIGNSVTSIGNNAFYNCNNLTKVVWNAINYPDPEDNQHTPFSTYNHENSHYDIRGQITSFTFGKNVKHIPAYLCYGMSNISSWTVPSSITSIGYLAFGGNSIIDLYYEGTIKQWCSKTWYISCKYNLYIDNMKVSALVIPSSVTSIGSSAFYNCCSLTSVTIPNSVTSIGNSAFSGCSGLTSVTIPNSITSIGSFVFYGCSSLTSITIPNSVTNIGDYAFYYCCGLTSVVIPNSVTSIGDGAFEDCSGLTSVVWNAKNCSDFSFAPFTSAVTSFTFGSGVEHIPAYLCYGMSNLTSMTIPSSVTSIGASAFYNCSGLNSITIPNSVTSVATKTFYNCSSLTSVVWNAKNCSDFSSAPFTSAVTSFTFGNEVEHLPAYLCSGMSNLTSVTIPNSVTSIGNYAFSGCSGLTSITIPNSVTSIGNKTFYNCSSLISVVWKAKNCNDFSSAPFASTITSFTLGEEVEHIPADLCYNMTSLSSISIPHSVTSVGTKAFYGCKYPIYVQCGDLERMKQLLSDYANYVQYESAPTYNLSTKATNGTVSTTKTKFTVCEEPLVTCTAKATTRGYQFAKWADGNTDNPRTIELTKDTIIEALFEIASSGKCGRDNSLVWKYDTNTKALTITGEGALDANYTYGTFIESVTIGSGVTSIGSGAFSGCSSLTNIYATCGDLDRVKQLLNNDSRVKYAPLPYTITVSAINGSVNVPNICEDILIATPNYGYHFVQWSDGVSDNPRTIELTQDTTFTAEFAKNTYTITTAPSTPEWGTTAGDTTALYLDEVEISATSNYGYHFVRWSDNNTQNPRTYTITADATLTAIFAKNIYNITKNAEHGTISGNSSAKYLDEVTLSVTPNYGYHFAQWSDGNTDNPRTFVLTQDTTFTAEFAISSSGTCGYDNLLTWKFDKSNKTLVISGNGSLICNYTFGLEAPTQTERLIIEEGVTSIGNNAFSSMSSSITSLALPSSLTFIGDSAFAGLKNRKFNTLVLPNTIISIGAHAFDGASYLQTIHFGSVLEEIGAYAFNGCVRVKEMTCLAEITPNVGTSGLTSISNLAKLFVPVDYLFDYQIDNNWNRFDLQTLGATETTVTENDVTVEPDDNSVVITWPTNDNAATYTIVITKDDEVVCTLIFNADGQLTGIAFAPSKNGTPRQVPVAKKVEKGGLQFTVTGLNSSTNYSYSVVAKDAQEEVVDSYEGEFSTTGDTPTAIDEITDEQSPITNKLLRNGQILILRGEKVYTIDGRLVR